ncbi:MAG: DUF1501 domain-containing protein [gamma proteobacterium endosymbiont of Lamellibrachia anaximandri]|nr:DUF1501 domain-containing protein [gamma proteobacterium endosymbiont of Lamellibrachia anaximandri]
MNRRDFLRLVSAAPVWSVMPVWSRQGNPVFGRTLLLLELNGGNDGINTLIPYRESAYYRQRPTLALPVDQILQLNEQTGMHPALESLMPLWEAGEMAWIQGLGYPQPNRSHFRSIAIWDSASASDEIKSEGWLSPVVKALPLRDQKPLDGIMIGRNKGPLAGEGMRVVSLSDSDVFLRRAASVKPVGQISGNPALQHILQVQREIGHAAAALRERLTAQTHSIVDRFPSSRFGRELALAARLIISGVDVPVIKVAQSGYDTHSHQSAKHRRLLTEVAKGLAAFRSVLTESRDWNRTLVMSYGEFGRRVAENASAGTDHGTAAPYFVLGGAVKQGLFGEAPSLTSLDGGDLRFTVDYRRYYGTVASKWFGVSGTGIAEQRHDPLGFIL